MDVWGFSLHWDWNPVVFFFWLAVTLVIATTVFKKRQVAWVLPALVLYAGLDWALPMSWLFRLVFWVVLVVAVVTAFRPNDSKLAKVPFNMMAALIALIIFLSGINWALDAQNGDDKQQNGNGKQKDGDDKQQVCPVRFVQKLDPNEKFRFVSEGFEGTSKQKRVQLVNALARDYRYLDFVGEQLFHESIAEESLVTEVDDQLCLTAKGRQLHAKVEGALMASGVKNGPAPADSCNTGMKDDRAVVAKKCGLYGDRSATHYTLADGSTLIVLDRCGNLPLATKPKGMPEGPTDNPTPPEDSPPGGGDNLQPKSSNSDDYVHEEGAPLGSVNGEEASEPSSVQTQSTGGREVQDSPTKPPGSETGVQAPGADPAPTSPPPPEEEGANDPSDGGTTCAPAPGEDEC